MSQYQVRFDQNNPNFAKEFAYNQMFIQSIQNWMNDILVDRGHVLLNDAYNALGFAPTTSGLNVGWVRGGSEVKFTVTEDRGALLIDFNVEKLNIFDEI